MINFSFKNEIVDSLHDGIQSRAVSSLYGTFVISWALLHWNFLYTALFVSDELIFRETGFLKNEYLIQRFFNIFDWYFYLSWIMPFVLTWIFIWVLPKVLLLPAFKKDEDYRTEKIKIRLEADKKVTQKETELEKQTSQKLQAVADRASIEREVERIDPTIAWENEYASFKSTNYYPFFTVVLEAIYEHTGKTQWNIKGTLNYTGIDSKFLAYLHSNGIVDLSTGEYDAQYISLTSKGKFFAAKYTEENDS